MSLIGVERHAEPNTQGVVAVVTLKRPTAKNAINKTLSSELTRALDTVRLDDSVRAVILTGGPDVFCAGVDLKDPVFADTSLMTKKHLDGPDSYLWQLQNIKVPLIAAVAGPCITGGLELALNCDIIVAAPSAVFRDTHANFGIVPGGGMTQLLPRMVGLQMAKWMSLASIPINAERAQSVGLVSQVVASGSMLVPTAVRIGMSIAAMDPHVIRLVKKMQHEGQAFDVKDALAYELDIAIEAYAGMAKNATSTRQRLVNTFATRAKL